jgi:hypothetical protein
MGNQKSCYVLTPKKVSEKEKDHSQSSPKEKPHFIRIACKTKPLDTFLKAEEIKEVHLMSLSVFKQFLQFLNDPDSNPPIFKDSDSGKISVKGDLSVPEKGEDFTEDLLQIHKILLGLEQSSPAEPRATNSLWWVQSTEHLDFDVEGARAKYGGRHASGKALIRAAAAAAAQKGLTPVGRKANASEALSDQWEGVYAKLVQELLDAARNAANPGGDSGTSALQFLELGPPDVSGGTPDGPPVRAMPMRKGQWDSARLAVYSNSAAPQLFVCLFVFCILLLLRRHFTGGKRAKKSIGSDAERGAILDLEVGDQVPTVTYDAVGLAE